MNTRITAASLVGGLLVVLLVLPLSFGGTKSTLFWAVFWTLALYLAVVLVAIARQRRQH